MSRIDDFQGENSHLVECINALLDMDDAKALVPHGLGKGSHAYRMLTAASHRLSSATAKVERLEKRIREILPYTSEEVEIAQRAMDYGIIKAEDLEADKDTVMATIRAKLADYGEHLAALKGEEG